MIKVMLPLTLDLLDGVLFAAFGLITIGCWLLWGAGWACLTLGALLLLLLVVGIPTGKRGS